MRIRHSNTNNPVKQVSDLRIALLEKILHTTPQFIGVVRNGSFIMVNDAAVNMFEMNDEEALFDYSSSILQKIVPGATDIDEALATYVAPGKETLIQFETGHQKLFWGEVKVEALEDEGKPSYLICIANVDRLVRNREENLLEKQKFEALFNHATVGIVVADDKGKITMLNNMSEQIFGYTKAELTGEKVEKLIPADLHKRHEGHRHSFMKEPVARPMGGDRNLFAQKKDGTKFPVEISLSSYKLGDELFVIAFVIDTTVRMQHEAAIKKQNASLEKYSHEIRQLNVKLEKRVEERTLALRETLRQLELSREELRQALEKERELGDMKSRFVSMASHEFRTPLSSILSSAALIERYAEKEEQENRAKHVNRIKENVRNLTDILEDFLSLGKIEEGGIITKQETIRLPDFFAAVIHDFDNLKRNGQKIVYTHEGDHHVVTDSHLLKNVLINLLSNAIKFSDDESTVTVMTKLNKEHFRFSVKDEGIGISEEDQEHLFGRFFRGRNASNIKGTGLGLHIVSKYLELLKGKISCRSELNEGTEFIVTIKLPDT